MSFFAGVLAAAVALAAIVPQSSFAASTKPGQTQAGPAKPRLWADEVSDAIRPGGKNGSRDVGSTGNTGANGSAGAPSGAPGGGKSDSGKGGSGQGQGQGKGQGQGQGKGAGPGEDEGRNR